MISLDYSQITSDELQQVAEDIYRRTIEPFLQPADDGKFVVIDAASGDHEIDRNDYTACARLRSRRPDGRLWLMRVGQPAAHRFGRFR